MLLARRVGIVAKPGTNIGHVVSHPRDSRLLPCDDIRLPPLGPGTAGSVCLTGGKIPRSRQLRPTRRRWRFQRQRGSQQHSVYLGTLSCTSIPAGLCEPVPAMLAVAVREAAALANFSAAQRVGRARRSQGAGSAALRDRDPAVGSRFAVGETWRSSPTRDRSAGS